MTGHSLDSNGGSCARSTRRLRASRSSWAAAAQAAPGCSSGCATAPAAASAQYIDVERCATTPERFLAAVTAASPFPSHGATATPATPREAFDIAAALLRHGARRRAANRAPSCSTKSSSCARSKAFPGLRHVLRDLLDGAGRQPEPLRPDHPVRRARASAAARRDRRASK